MDQQIIQAIIDKAVRLAVSNSKNGQAVRVLWYPPINAVDDPKGHFAVMLAKCSTTAGNG